MSDYSVMSLIDQPERFERYVAREYIGTSECSTSSGHYGCILISSEGKEPGMQHIKPRDAGHTEPALNIGDVDHPTLVGEAETGSIPGYCSL